LLTDEYKCTGAWRQQLETPLLQNVDLGESFLLNHNVFYHTVHRHLLSNRNMLLVKCYFCVIVEIMCSICHLILSVPLACFYLPWTILLYCYVTFSCLLAFFS